MIGVIRVRGESVFVEYTAAQYTRPQRVVMLWRVRNVARCPYSLRWPQEGDEVTSGGSSDVWSGRGYSVSFPGDAQAEETRTEEIPPPRVRAGTETRWARGQWEKRTAKGKTAHAATRRKEMNMQTHAQQAIETRWHGPTDTRGSVRS